MDGSKATVDDSTKRDEVKEYLEGFRNHWYGNLLKTSKEKSLLDISDKNVEVYRFTWLRSFHNPIVVRFERQKDVMKVYFKELKRSRRISKPVKLFREKMNSIDSGNWCKLIEKLNEADYWKMPSIHRDVTGYDGAQWILEGVKDNRYHIVDRWSPEKGAYREAGLLILKFPVSI